MKENNINGEEFLKTGKLNLVGKNQENFFMASPYENNTFGALKFCGVNDCFGFMEVPWISNMTNWFIGSHKIFCS